jgi:uncharacterized membrane protein (UPF0127 family)
MKRVIRRMALATAILPALLFAGIASAQPLALLELSVGLHRIEAEVAATQPARAQGLMHRTAMPPQHGMLFVFPQDAAHCFWMKNTLLPLSIAFIDADGRVVQIAEMTPRSEQNHCATRPVRYALEMNAGWFVQRGLKTGDRVAGIERAPQGQ